MTARFQMKGFGFTRTRDLTYRVNREETRRDERMANSPGCFVRSTFRKKDHLLAKVRINNILSPHVHLRY